MKHPATVEERDLQMIQSITSIEELDGYEAEAKRRGLRPHEPTAMIQKRRELKR